MKKIINMLQFILFVFVKYEMEDFTSEKKKIIWLCVFYTDLGGQATSLDVVQNIIQAIQTSTSSTKW